MALTKYKLGELIKQRREKYDGLEELPIKGVAREGFISPKQDGADLSIYNVYYLNDFVFNPARMELNSIALNTFWDKAICSSLYEIFYVTRTDILLPEYLNLFIKRDEFARKCWFEAVGSARNYFRVADLSEFDIELPDIPTQQKYVDIYKAMVANQQSYERGLADLKLVCDSYIESLRKTLDCKRIGAYIKEIDVRNKDNKVTLLQGFCMSGDFIEPRRTSIDIPSLKVLKNGEMIYNRAVECVTDRFIVSIREGETCAVSNSYIIFSSKDEKRLLNKYLLLWLRRKEFARYSKFKSHGTAHENFEFEDLCEVKIPIPNIEIQQSIVDIYECYTKKKSIADKLAVKIREICPILIKGSIEEAKEV